MKRKLVLENGLVFEGEGFGSSLERVSELVFNTSVVGYQEILSDPASFNQMVCMTYPVIGSYGLTDEDYESKGITVSGVIVREYNDEPSNFRYTHKLGEVMDEQDVAGISEIDTRELTRVIRDNGTMKALICDIDKPMAECLEMIKGYKEENTDAALISSKKVWHSRTANPNSTVVVIDCGIKRSIIKMLNNNGSNVVVVPHKSTVEEIMKQKPTGILISDGPGNPNRLTDVISLIRSLKGSIPIMGLGMGMDLIALAYGCKASKERVGHHGCNLPVRDLETGKIEITSQNDLYATDKESLKDSGLVITHLNVIDGAAMGLKDEENSVIAIKYSPSNDIKSESHVMYKFAKLMQACGGNKNAKKNRY